AEIGMQTYSPDYNLILLVIPLLLYFNEEEGPVRRDDGWVLGCLGLLFVPKTYGVLALRGEYAFQTLTPQALLNPLILLILFCWLARSARAARPGPDQGRPQYWGLRRSQPRATEPATT